MHFVIAGSINCPQFSYALMVAQRLKENLPDFSYQKIPKKPEEWGKWLVNICRENDWYHTQSPLIWREIGLKKGKKDFIGNINKFLDLCYDYYGIPQDVLSAEQFSRGEMNWFTNRTESEFFENIKLEAKEKRTYRSRQVCITGASNRVAEIVIMELLQIDLQRREDGLEIRLFDEPTQEKKLMGSANDAKYCPGSSGFGNCRVVTTLKDALTNIDLVIVLDSFSRKPKETVVKWLKRNRNAMCALGKALNLYAPTHCRVIVGSPSHQPICYNATVLASFATKLHVRNIVVVTQDLGREILKPLSTKTNVPLKDFYCPPVWGFIGLNKYIDVRRTLQRHLYKVPGKSVNSSFPQGKEEYELRTSECVLTEDDSNELHCLVSNHKVKSYPQLGRCPIMAKATAIVDLLKVWGLKQEDGNGEILCLGVYSDGTFNIPRGIYWSQPVILSNGFWVPFADFPIPLSPHFDCYYLLLYSIAALYRTKVKPRIYIPPKKVLKSKDNKTLNFRKVAEEVGMPVIRTDAECVVYLKLLAKKELGIDLDEVPQDITEEEEEEDLESEAVPMEEVTAKPVFCECWRQELREFQKIVFDRFSTTEVEVDLSDNMSGSEWPVINVTSKISSKIPSPKGRSMEQPSSSSTIDTVCTCGRLSTGFVCQCLGAPESQDYTEVGFISKFSKGFGNLDSDDYEEKIYPEEKNTQDFDYSLKDEVVCEESKRVSFDLDAKEEDDTGFRVKFYGKKDAIRNEEYDLKMKKRILRYERDDEESSDQEEEREEENISTTLRKTKEAQDDKFQISAGVSEEILEDKNNEECLKKMLDAGEKSSTTLTEMHLGEIKLTISDPSSDTAKSSKSSEKDFWFGEDNRFSFENSQKYLSEHSSDKISARNFPGEQMSTTALESELDALWNEELSREETNKEEDGLEDKTAKIHKRKREGIPLCCLCRCIVPEGLSCCPCGATTVVEVFKKESTEVIIQSEDDFSYRVEYFDADESSALSLEGKEEKGRGGEKEEKEKEEEEEDFLPKKELPPESFLPFFPKPYNKFRRATRPRELTKEYIDSFKKTEKELPAKCAELLEKAKMELEEKTWLNEEDEEEQKSNKHSENEIENMPPIYEETEQIKTDFSDLKLFVPCGIEDWRLTLQKKYRQWFFQGSKIKDESYYDIAVEDVSEDEFEVDKEMEKYFEN